MERNETGEFSAIEFAAIAGLSSTLLIATLLYILVSFILSNLSKNPWANPNGNSFTIELPFRRGSRCPPPTSNQLPYAKPPRRTDLQGLGVRLSGSPGLRRSIKSMKTDIEFGPEEYIFWRGVLGLIDRANVNPGSYSYLNQFNRELTTQEDDPWTEITEERLPIEWSHVKGLGIWVKGRKGYLHVIAKIPTLVQRSFEAIPGKYYIRSSELYQNIKELEEVIEYRKSQLKHGTERYPAHCRAITELEGMRDKLIKIYEKVKMVPA